MALARPVGHHTITPSAIVPDARRVIAFLEQAFGAKEVDRYEYEGAIMHVEMKIGDSVVMMGEPMEGFEPMPAMLTVYVDGADAVDATYRKALAAGATSLQEPKDEFFGHRTARVRDVAGNKWGISAVIEDVTPDEAKKRFAAMTGQVG